MNWPQRRRTSSLMNGFVHSSATAIEMPPAEQRTRMRRMRQVVAGHDVFLWASGILDSLEHRRIAVAS